MDNLPPTLYDEVLYPSALYQYTHPDRLATMARLFGLRTAPVESCRVLELGCGDGTNQIAMAYALPQSQFVGIDLAARPIAAGQETVKELGLSNITLRQLDLMQVPAELEPFDFIIAHGVYSWVSDAVRDKLLELCGTLLTDNGVAYVSYNAYPGWHFRDLSRGMMLYHVAKFSDPDQKIQQGLALLKFLAESKEEPDPYHAILKDELNLALTQPDTSIFHDNLSAINQPLYFHEFVEHAARHDLQYLSEANLETIHIESYTPPVRALLENLDPADIISREQYNDFLECRPFRRTLLCRNRITLDRTLPFESLYTLRLAADFRPVSEVPDLRSASPELFKGTAGAEIESSRPLVKAAFARLGTVWPQSIAFDDLITAVLSDDNDNPAGQKSPPENARQELAQALRQAHLASCVELHAYQAPFVTTVSHRPMASALARLQLSKSPSLSTLRHEALKIEDSLCRQLVLLLDGTRDRSALLNDLGESLKSGVIVVNQTGKLAVTIDEATRALGSSLEANLRSLARLAVLVA